jgi:hypothetical protein
MVSNDLAREEGYGKENFKPHFLKERWGFYFTEDVGLI